MGALDGPFVALFHEDGSDGSRDRGFVREWMTRSHAGRMASTDTPTTSVLRLISPLSRSMGLVL